MRSLAAKKAEMDMTKDRMMSGRMMRSSGMPAAFMASSSLNSPILPIVMIEASRVARGSAMGITVQVPQKRNSRITFKPRPFPTNSSI